MPGGVGQLGDTAGPAGLWLGEEGIDALADAGVEDGGDVAGSGQVARCDGGAEDLGRVQPGEFGGVQSAVQAEGSVGELAAGDEVSRFGGNRSWCRT